VLFVEYRDKKPEVECPGEVRGTSAVAEVCRRCLERHVEGVVSCMENTYLSRSRFYVPPPPPSTVSTTTTTMTSAEHSSSTVAASGTASTTSSSTSARTSTVSQRNLTAPEPPSQYRSVDHSNISPAIHNHLTVPKRAPVSDTFTSITEHHRSLPVVRDTVHFQAAQPPNCSRSRTTPTQQPHVRAVPVNRVDQRPKRQLLQFPSIGSMLQALPSSKHEVLAGIFACGVVFQHRRCWFCILSR